MKFYLFIVLVLFAKVANSADVDALLFEKSKEINTGVEIVEVEGERYLVSVGKAVFDSTKPKSKLNAIRVSRQLAEDGALKFIHGSKLTVSERLSIKDANGKTEETTKLTYGDRLSAATDVYKETGAWEQNNEYFTGIYYMITK